MNEDILKQYHLDRFVSAEENQFAGKMIENVLKTREFFPVLLYGPSGCGKTHLLYGAAQALKHAAPEKKIYHPSCLLLEEQLCWSAQRADTAKNYLSNYSKLDLLLLDNLNHFLHKPAMLDEVFKLISAPLKSGGNVIMAATGDYAQLNPLIKHIEQQFPNALAIALHHPSLATRKAIAAYIAEELGIRLTDAQLDTIAENNLDGFLVQGAVKRYAFDAPAQQSTISQEKMLSDTSLMLREFSLDYKRMAE